MTVITLSRQVGSFGNEIAAMVAEEMKLELMGQDEIHQMAQACHPGFKHACELYERDVTKGWRDRFFFNEPAFSSLFESLNYELAARGNVVILGRGAQIVLADTPGVFKCRVVAPSRIRVERIMAENDLDEEKAADFVYRHDVSHKSLIEMVFHKDLSDWSLYDLILNTAAMTPELGAKLVCDAVRGMNPVPDEAVQKERLRRLAFAKHVESVIKKKIATTYYRNIEVESPAPGVAVIKGHVESEEAREAAGKAASRVEGVERVENHLEKSKYLLSFT